VIVLKSRVISLMNVLNGLLTSAHWIIYDMQGVLRLGGTFAVDCGVVKFAHSDGVPGDHPDIAKVIEALN